MNSLKSSNILTLVSLFGLLLLVVIWNGWLATVQNVPRSFEIAVFCIPLLFFMRGILYGRRGTHVAAMVLAFFYFLAGISHVIDPADRLYGVLMIILSLGLYLGGYFYARNHDRVEQAKLDAAEAEASAKEEANAKADPKVSE